MTIAIKKSTGTIRATRGAAMRERIVTAAIEAFAEKGFEAASMRDIARRAGIEESHAPHAFYALAGAGSLIFAVASKCRRLSGVNPRNREAIETHADFIANLVVP